MDSARGKDVQAELNAIMARGTQVYLKTASDRVADLRRFIGTIATPNGGF